MNNYTDYIELRITDVNRAEIVLPLSSVPALLAEARNRNFKMSVDGYEDVYILIPWTAKKERLTEFVKLVFEFTGLLGEFQLWLGEWKERLEVTLFYVSTAKRGAIRQLKKPNPNPNKWFNKGWPVVKDYPTNIMNASTRISTNRIGSTFLEVNCPLSTDDLGLLCDGLLGKFPKARLIEISQGYEHAIDSASGKEMNLATARLVFDISAVQEEEYPVLFAEIEVMHSFVVPVMRVFGESTEVRSKRFEWGL